MSTKLCKEELYLCKMLSCALTEREFYGQEEDAQNSVDMDAVLQLAEKHKVLPMIYNLLDGMEDKLDSHLLTMAKVFTEQTTKQSYRLLFLTRHLVGLLEKMIPVVVLKGSVAASYYPVPEYRKSGDVDLLLKRPEDLQVARSILEKHAYYVKEEQHANHHLVFCGTEDIDVELHTMMAEPFDDDGMNTKLKEYGERIFEGRIQCNAMGLALPMAPEDCQAFSLLTHMLQHYLRAGFGLKLLADWVVFWNKVQDKSVAESYCRMAEECGVEGFSKAITLVCEKYLGLTAGRIYSEHLEDDFSENYCENFLKDILDAEEFGKADGSRMVALRKRSLWGYVKEFHYQMRMNYPEKSKNKLLWPVLWVKTLVVFMKNNRKLSRGSVYDILKNAGERGKMVEEMKIFHS